MEVSLWHLWRFSLFPDMKLKIDTILELPKISNQNLSDDILFRTMQLPIICDFFYINHFWDFIEVYKSAFKLFNNETVSPPPATE